MSTLNTSEMNGPLLGYLIHWGLYGVLSVQVYVYYLAFPKDSLHTKILVYGVYAVSLIQTILFSKAAFHQYASGFGNLHAWNDGSLLWFASPIISSAVAVVVQIFYAYRIKILSHSNLIAMVVVVFALAQLGGGLAEGIIAHEVTFLYKYLVRRTLIAIGIHSAASAVCDVIIAIAMVYYLFRWRTTWEPTQRIVQKLARLIIETGLLTAAVAVLNCVLSVMPGHSTYFYTTTAVLGKMYSNTLMIVLNSRVKLSIVKESAWDDLSSRVVSSVESPRSPVFAASPSRHSRHTVTREHWSIPVEVYDVHRAKGLEAVNLGNVHAPVSGV